MEAAAGKIECGERTAADDWLWCFMDDDVKMVQLQILVAVAAATATAKAKAKAMAVTTVVSALLTRRRAQLMRGIAS
jgi:hypothetical protein